MGDLSVRRGAPCVRLLGREGVGRATLGAALRARGVAAVDDGDADALLYCFAGGLRATDRAAIEALDADSAGPAVLAWTKADAAGSWRAADDYAARLGEVLGRPVVAVVALLDGADPADIPVIRRIAASGLALPESALAAAEALGEDAPLLRRFGGYGLACALGALRETPSMPDEVLLASLRELSGVDALLPSLATALQGFEERREARFDGALRAAAATDCARRDEAEHLLLDRLGRAS
ncbi:hypothetical protein FK530_21935 [Tsukamurella conjunctivitidis]|uniref:Uncharacterized protein n=1 Tax=Tsukamurella conjunctivitidis TaxID=2592068 RepID=A0A5C5RVM6_9ACTN|nr:hypothetical protein [Tsukamurella conjunctivitidis]TWS26824.1 hypothetical protein FK530_21935 [Tsukamurella conjunctivitidis]